MRTHRPLLSRLARLRRRRHRRGQRGVVPRPPPARAIRIHSAISADASSRAHLRSHLRHLGDDASRRGSPATMARGAAPDQRPLCRRTAHDPGRARRVTRGLRGRGFPAVPRRRACVPAHVGSHRRRARQPRLLRHDLRHARLRRAAHGLVGFRSIGSCPPTSGTIRTWSCCVGVSCRPARRQRAPDVAGAAVSRESRNPRRRPSR